MSQPVATRFAELSDFTAIPRVTALRPAPDGQWLAVTVASLSPDGKKYVSSIWRVDLTGAPPVRLTRSAEGESEPGFLPDGSLLFLSARPDPAAKPGDDDSAEKPALWALPPGGEAYRIAAPPGGVTKLATASEARSFVIIAPAFDGATDEAGDAARRKARADADVTAILHDGDWPVRHWDEDLGPDCPRLFAGSLAEAGVKDLTPEPGQALDDQAIALSPDGTVAVTGWQVSDGLGFLRNEVVAFDVATGERRLVASVAGYDFIDPVISPDGQLVAAIRAEHDSPARCGDFTLAVAPLAGGSPAGPRDLLADFDRRPAEAAWSPDSATLYFTADDNGRRPIFAVDVASGQLRKLTTDDAAYSSLGPAPDGQSLYALRSAIGEPHAPVRIDLAKADAEPERLASPVPALSLPGRVTEVTTVVADGSTVRGWLALPHGASAADPAPLVLWVHGGPYNSWNDWSWRWNPWIMVARGYAVLLPDPALSTGYGRDFIARGYSGWGGATYTDVMMITDVVTAMPEIDGTRTAMMGGSFGGYMANWIAGHTDRFSAIVSHAGIWALDQMLSTTDGPFFWRREFGTPETHPERYRDNSPHLHASAITTPVLIIHGDKDYRVPIGEALRMYADLVGLGKTVKFLYFPQENHWILKPGDAAVWYETIFAFLAVHVLGKEWERPALV
jgi:dipeptidyl aminopeptidase/acylaminoacyl peptidase